MARLAAGPAWWLTLLLVVAGCKVDLPDRGAFAAAAKYDASATLDASQDGGGEIGDADVGPADGGVPDGAPTDAEPDGAEGDVAADTVTGPDTDTGPDTVAPDTQDTNDTADATDTADAGDAADTGCADAAPCEDGDPCTAGDACKGGVCLPGAPTSCDDANPCTDDTCEAGQGCAHDPLSGDACDDGNACTQGDACNSGFCVPETTVACDDGEACTLESCNPQKGCVFVKLDGPCDDGDACTGTAAAGDTCAQGLCQAGAAVVCNDDNPCTTDSCDAAKGCQTAPADSAKCDDGDPCTGVGGDTCQAGQCGPGAPKSCDDANSCTTDACDAKTGACGHVGLGDGAACQDGSACTGTPAAPDSCLQSVCQAGAIVDCLDGDACTADACDPGQGCVAPLAADAVACPSQANACWTKLQCGAGCQVRPRLFQAPFVMAGGALAQALVAQAGADTSAGLAVAAAFDETGGPAETDIVLARFDAAGGLAWRWRFGSLQGGPAVDAPAAVRALPDGRLAVAGTVHGGSGGGDLAVLVASSDGTQRAVAYAATWPGGGKPAITGLRDGALVLEGDLVALGKTASACAVARFALAKDALPMVPGSGPVTPKDPGGFRALLGADVLPGATACAPAGVVSGTLPDGGAGLAVLATVGHAGLGLDQAVVVWLEATTGKVVTSWAVPAAGSRVAVGLAVEDGDLLVASRGTADPADLWLDRYGASGWRRWRQRPGDDGSLGKAAQSQLISGSGGQRALLQTSALDSRLLHLGDPVAAFGVQHRWSRLLGTATGAALLGDDGLALVGPGASSGSVLLRRLDPFGNGACTAACTADPAKTCKAACIDKDALFCDDSQPCTFDDCQPEAALGCESDPAVLKDAPCDDGTPCTLGETCVKSGLALGCSAPSGSGQARYDAADGQSTLLRTGSAASGALTWRDAVADPATGDLWLVGQGTGLGGASTLQGRVRRLSPTGSGTEALVEVFTGGASSSRKVDATAVAPAAGGGVVVCGAGVDTTVSPAKRARFVRRYRATASGQVELAWQYTVSLQVNHDVTCDGIVGLPSGGAIVAGRGSSLGSGLVVEQIEPDGTGAAKATALTGVPGAAANLQPNALARLADGRLVVTGSLTNASDPKAVPVLIGQPATGQWTLTGAGAATADMGSPVGLDVVAREDGGFALLARSTPTTGGVRGMLVIAGANGSPTAQTVFRDEQLPMYNKLKQSGLDLDVRPVALTALPSGELAVLLSLVEEPATSPMQTPEVHHAWLLRLAPNGKAHVGTFPPFGTAPGGGPQAGGPGQPPKIYDGVALAGFDDGSLGVTVFERTATPPGQPPPSLGVARTLRVGRHANVPATCDACDAAPCQDTNDCNVHTCSAASGVAECKTESKTMCTY